MILSVRNPEKSTNEPLLVNGVQMQVSLMDVSYWLFAECYLY